MEVGSPGNRLPWELCCLHGAARGGGLMVGPSVGLRCVFLLCMGPGAQHTARCSLVQAMGGRGQGSAGGSTSASVSSARVKAWQGGWGPAALISIVISRSWRKVFAFALLRRQRHGLTGLSYSCTQMRCHRCPTRVVRSASRAWQRGTMRSSVPGHHQWRHGDISVSCCQHFAVIQEKDGDKDAGRWAPLWDAGCALSTILCGCSEPFWHRSSLKADALICFQPTQIPRYWSWSSGPCFAAATDTREWNSHWSKDAGCISHLQPGGEAK